MIQEKICLYTVQMRPLHSKEFQQAQSQIQLSSRNHILFESGTEIAELWLGDFTRSCMMIPPALKMHQDTKTHHETDKKIGTHAYPFLHSTPHEKLQISTHLTISLILIFLSPLREFRQRIDPHLQRVCTTVKNTILCTARSCE